MSSIIKRFMKGFRAARKEEPYGTFVSESPDVWPWPVRYVSVKPLFKTLGFGAYIEKNGQKPEGAMFPIDSYVLMVETVSEDGKPAGKQPVCDFYNKDSMLQFCNMVSKRHGHIKLKAEKETLEAAIKIVKKEFAKNKKFPTKASQQVSKIEKEILDRLEGWLICY